jgi:hypothetical protein
MMNPMFDSTEKSLISAYTVRYIVLGTFNQHNMQGSDPEKMGFFGGIMYSLYKRTGNEAF